MVLVVAPVGAERVVVVLVAVELVVEMAVAAEVEEATAAVPAVVRVEAETVVALGVVALVLC